jgi:hypothetical protein
MFVFLSSSLNVELVYSILKGVTSFGYIMLLEADNPIASRKIKQMALTGVDDGMRITINKIKIKDEKLWDQTSYQDFLQENWVKSTDSKAVRKIKNEDKTIVVRV